MELFLNLVWVLVAGAMVCVWLRSKDRDEPWRRRRLIAMAMLIVLLFPVISMSDDLLAVQTAFEADNYLRRDHLAPADSYAAQPALMLAVAIFSGLGVGFVRFVAPSLLPIHAGDHPEVACIENRPPPAA